jgi:hypothetical protein
MYLPDSEFEIRAPLVTISELSDRDKKSRMTIINVNFG